MADRNCLKGFRQMTVSDFDISTMTDDDLITSWRDTKCLADRAKARELEYRNAIVSRMFPYSEPGTANRELGHGYELKCVNKLTYTLDSSNDSAATYLAVNSLNELTEGRTDTARLIKWKPEISVTEYKMLSPAAKKIIDKVLTIKNALPTLELKEPK